MGALGSILDGKDKAIHSVGPDATVFDAIDRMCRARIGALLVLEHDIPVGIVSERDIMTRVMLQRRDPSKTNVAAVMSTELACVGVDAEPEEAMSVMTTRRCRHLPVVQDGHVVGIVSMGDLIHWASRTQEYEIRALKEYVSGVYAG